jgi:hypothetical protein
MEIRPPKVPQYDTGRGRHPILPVPPLRAMVLAPSGSGKTVLLSSMILDQYRGAWSRVYIFSPSVHIDAAWGPVKKYSEQVLGVDPKRETCFFDEWDEPALRQILKVQEEMVKYQKRHRPNGNKIFGILVCVDDFADNPAVMHSSSNVLTALTLRGRHWMTSTVLSTQKYRAISTPIRTNMLTLFVFRLRNAKETEALYEELSALYPKKTLEAIYNYATREPYSFLTVQLDARRPEDLFTLRFERPIVAEEAE